MDRNAKISPSGTTSAESTRMQIITAAGKLLENELIIKQWPIQMITKQHGPEESEVYYFKELLKLQLHVNPATWTEEAIETWRQRKLKMCFADNQMVVEGIIPDTAQYSQKKWPTTHGEMALVDLDVVQTSISTGCLNRNLRSSAEAMKTANTDFGVLMKYNGGEIPVFMLRSAWSEQRVHHRGPEDPVISRAQVCFPFVQTGARAPIYNPVYVYEASTPAYKPPFFELPPHHVLHSNGIILPQTGKQYKWRADSTTFEEVMPSPRTVTSPFQPILEQTPAQSSRASGSIAAGGTNTTVRKLSLDDTSPANASLKRVKRESDIATQRYQDVDE